MPKTNVKTTPWWQIGLTVLPGLALLLIGWANLADPLPDIVRIVALAGAILLGVAGVLPAILRCNLLTVQAYGLVPLGALVGIAANLGLWMVAGTLDLYLICYVVLVVASLAFAGRYGLGAGLFVLAGGIFPAAAVIEPGMYMGANPIGRVIIGEGMFVLFMVLVPIAVLRARTVVEQGLALLLPMALFAAVFVYALSSTSGLSQPYFRLSISQSISIARPFIFLFFSVVLAAPLYMAIHARHHADGQHTSTHHTASG